MEKATRQFQSHSYANPGEASIPIEINGRLWQFHPSIPAGSLIDFTVIGSNEEDPGAAASQVEAFFTDALVDGQGDAFKEFIRDPETKVDMEVLTDVAGYLMEIYAGERPTQPSSSSSGG